MSAFDRVIGYERIKEELRQVCDMMNNREAYQKLGARIPRGVLLFGDPGLGKTLMASCMIEESGRKAYTIRRNVRAEDFVSEITETFKMACRNAPSIVFMDDMDKFANEDKDHPNGAEYVAVQAGIDSIKDADVFVIATANEMICLPKSLTRAGRFDRKIRISSPDGQDAYDIIRYYMKDKKLSEDVNLEDVAKMINYCSCAELEAVLNEAAIYAGYAKRESISMNDITQAVLCMQYGIDDLYANVPEKERHKAALHEAGHLVVSEALKEGSVGIASLRVSSANAAGGYIRHCSAVFSRHQYILIALAGKAAVELYYSEHCASGCSSDLDRAVTLIQEDITENGTCGMGFLDVSTNMFDRQTQINAARAETVMYAELEQYMYRTRNILLNNRGFLEDAALALMEKGTLLYSDIRELCRRNNVVRAAV